MAPPGSEGQSTPRLPVSDSESDCAGTGRRRSSAESGSGRFSGERFSQRRVSQVSEVMVPPGSDGESTPRRRVSESGSNSSESDSSSKSGSSESYSRRSSADVAELEAAAADAESADAESADAESADAESADAESADVESADGYVVVERVTTAQSPESARDSVNSVGAADATDVAGAATGAAECQMSTAEEDLLPSDVLSVLQRVRMSTELEAGEVEHALERVVKLCVEKAKEAHDKAREAEKKGRELEKLRQTLGVALAASSSV